MSPKSPMSSTTTPTPQSKNQPLRRRLSLGMHSPSNHKLENLYLCERVETNDLKKEVREMFVRMAGLMEPRDIQSMLLENRPLKKLYGMFSDSKIGDEGPHGDGDQVRKVEVITID